MRKKVLFDEIISGRKAFNLKKMEIKNKLVVFNISFIIAVIIFCYFLYDIYYLKHNFLDNLDKIVISIFILTSVYAWVFYQMSTWTRMRILEDGIEIEYIFRTKFIHKDHIMKFLINSRKGAIVIVLKNGKKIKMHRSKSTIRTYFLWRKNELVDALNSLGVDYEILF